MPQITRKHRANAQIGEALHSAVLAVSESYQRLWETPNIADHSATTLQNDGLDVLRTAYTVLSALVAEANANAAVKVD